MSSVTSSSAPADKPLNELLSTSLVDIYVGQENTRWTLHEKLLCHHSPFFRARFYNKNNHPESVSSTTFGLPDSDDLPFELLVGWLYSKALRYPEQEKDVGPMLDLYFLAQQFEMQKLSEDVVETVRAFYHNQQSYPGLRRVSASSFPSPFPLSFCTHFSTHSHSPPSSISFDLPNPQFSVPCEIYLC